MRHFTTKPRIYIFSAERSENTDRVNKVATSELSSELALAGIPFREGTGSYKGALEVCFVVAGAEHDSAVLELADRFNQATVLVIAENDRDAYLCHLGNGTPFPAGYYEFLGRLEGSAVEPNADAWTLLDDVFYFAAPRKGVDLPEGI